MALYFITGNKGKFSEIASILPEIKQLDIDLPELQEIDAHKIITTKLQEALKHRSGQFIVEDTSLHFDALQGLPGPLIKWFLQILGNDGLFELADKYKNYQVTAKTIIGYAYNKTDIQFFTGEIKGKIVAPRGDQGFGWNPIFQPDGEKRTYAQMTPEEKNKCSMRRIAAEKLKLFLNETNA